MTMIGRSKYERLRSKGLFDVLLHIREVALLQIVVKLGFCVEPIGWRLRTLPPSSEQWHRRIRGDPAYNTKFCDLVLTTVF